VLIMSQGRSVAEGPPARLVREVVGSQVTEVYGPRAELDAVESQMRAAGYKTRRTGTSVAVLGTESGNGDVPDGPTRVASLEDVFVLLTGEVVE
jgi:lipooligosaccharide transport system ATP-binding protein